MKAQSAIGDNLGGGGVNLGGGGGVNLGGVNLGGGGVNLGPRLGGGGVNLGGGGVNLGLPLPPREKDGVNVGWS